MSAGEGIDVWRTWERLGKSVEDVIKDFLQLLFQHMVSTLAYEGLGENRIDYNTIFTVPAGFSPNEVQKFKSIVQSTGWGNHAISVSLREPEAAILYTINKSASHFDFQTGQCIVLCDAGGGTVVCSMHLASVYYSYDLFGEAKSRESDRISPHTR